MFMFSLDIVVLFPVAKNMTHNNEEQNVTARVISLGLN